MTTRFNRMAVAAALGLATMTTTIARADQLVTAANFDALLSGLGSLNATGPDTDFVTPAPNVGAGRAAATVYYNFDTHVSTYVYTVKPSLPTNAFYTGFILGGDFNGVAGFSFSSAGAAGGPASASAFQVLFTDQHQLIFSPNGSWFGRFDTVSFFFQLGGPVTTTLNSDPPPVDITTTTITTTTTTTTDPDPVVTLDLPSDPIAAPEPASIGLVALGAAALLRRRHRPV